MSLKFVTCIIFPSTPPPTQARNINYMQAIYVQFHFHRTNISSPDMAASPYCKNSYVHAFLHATLTLLLLVMPLAAASLAFNYQQLGDAGNATLSISGDVNSL